MTTDILDVVHAMSLQKIIAYDKWTHTHMTTETVDQLYDLFTRDDNNIKYKIE